MIHHCVFRNVTKTSALLSTNMEDTVLANFTLRTKGNWYDSLNLSPMFFSSLATDAMITSVFGLLRESGSSLKSGFELLSRGFSLFSLAVLVLSILNSCKKITKLQISYYIFVLVLTILGKSDKQWWIGESNSKIWCNGTCSSQTPILTNVYLLYVNFFKFLKYLWTSIYIIFYFDAGTKSVTTELWSLMPLIKRECIGVVECLWRLQNTRIWFTSIAINIDKHLKNRLIHLEYLGSSIKSEKKLTYR